MEWYDDIKKNYPELLPENIKNNMYNELSNFAQTLHYENNLNLTVINYILEKADVEDELKYRFVLRIYENTSVLPRIPESKIIKNANYYNVNREDSYITHTIIKFENFFYNETNNNTYLNNNFNMFDNSNVNYINISNYSNNNSNNFNYLSVPITIAEIV
jgi:hypothetical protein